MLRIAEADRPACPTARLWVVLVLVAQVATGCVAFYDTDPEPAVEYGPDTADVFPDAPDAPDDAHAGVDADASDGGSDVDPSDIGDVQPDGSDVGSDTDVGADADADTEVDSGPLDEDNDGFVFPDDCAPTDPSIYPGAPEVCDSIDNNCNDTVDEGLPVQTYRPDADGDGFGDADIEILACAPPANAVLDDPESLDCDDSSAAAYPGGEEVCDNLDNDCNGTTDFDGWIPHDVGTVADAALLGGYYCLDEGTWDAFGITPSAELTLEGRGPDISGLNANSSQGFDTVVPLTFRSLTVVNAASSEELGGFVDSVGANVTFDDVLFRDPVLNIGRGMLIQVGHAEFRATDVVIANAEVSLTDDWSGFFYVYSGLMEMERVEVHHASVFTTKDIWGTFYHYGGTARLTDVTVRDSTFETEGEMDGLVFCEEESSALAVHRRITAVDNQLAVEKGYFGAISLNNQSGRVAVENLRLSGNQITAEEIYTVVGYAFPEPAASWNNVIIAGETLTATNGTIRIAQSIGQDPDLYNWDIAYNSATSGDRRPILELGENAEIRNMTVIGNNVGPDFNHVARADNLSVRYCNVVEPEAEFPFIQDDEQLAARNSISADPLYTDVDSSPSRWDLRPLAGSPVIDVGDPSIRDTDDTRSDIGAYGGPLGDSWLP